MADVETVEEDDGDTDDPVLLSGVPADQGLGPDPEFADIVI